MPGLRGLFHAGCGGAMRRSLAAGLGHNRPFNHLVALPFESRLRSENSQMLYFRSSAKADGHLPGRFGQQRVGDLTFRDKSLLSGCFST